MTVLIALILLLLTLAFISYPFFRVKSGFADWGKDDKYEKGTDEVEADIERQVLKLRKGKGRFCPKCGRKYDEQDLFCSYCGVNLGNKESS
jgi:hypothetical protein